MQLIDHTEQLLHQLKYLVKSNYICKHWMQASQQVGSSI